MTLDMEQFIQTFLEESFEGLDAMESGLLSLEAGQSDFDTINEIFRAAHSIKGGSGTFGLIEISNYTHAVETLLDQLRSGDRQVTREVIDLLLRSVDALREMLTAFRDGTDFDQDKVNSIRIETESVLENGTPPAQDNETAGLENNDETGPSTPAGWHILFRPQPHILQTGNEPIRMFRELARLGELVVRADTTALPSFRDLPTEECHLSWSLVIQGNVPRGEICAVFEWVEDDCELQITDLTETAPAKDQTSDSTVSANPQTETRPGNAGAVERRTGMDRRAGGSDSGSIRVNIDKIDDLINMVGELVITQSMLGQLGEDFHMDKLDMLQDGLAQLERNTRELQESVMRIRMLPISFAFNRFPRLVHDLSQNLNKKVELHISGEQTELDKTVMEKVGDPLVHLVRNAMDHGIESPQTRLSAGKPESGNIHLNAYHQGGNIVIEIKDDGKGLNEEHILNKARALGLVSDNQVLAESELHDLIFHPGFSTADEVSEVSGRGVGMDVVRRNIEELGGNIDVASREGAGMTFTIRLPLTLAILDGQLLRVGNQIYIIPLVAIIESLQIQPEHINTTAKQLELYKLRDEYIPIARLYDLFSVQPDSKELSGGLLVVVEGDTQKVGLFVDELLGQQQVVIKSLEANYKRVDGISGATILGDGTVALILDVAGLVRGMRGNRGRMSGQGQEPAAA